MINRTCMYEGVRYRVLGIHNNTVTQQGRIKTEGCFIVEDIETGIVGFLSLELKEPVKLDPIEGNTND